MAVRLFLAINPQPEVRRAMIEATSDLRAAAPTLNWMDESRVHLTLKFLGEQDEAVVAPLAQMLDRVARGHRPFPMRVSEVGAFPNFRRARVVWMGVDRDVPLELLHHDVELACAALGFEVDGRAFRPHLTLKFLGEQDEAVVAPLAQMLDRVARGHRAFPMRVSEVGAFPNFRRARVVWMGVDRDVPLELLHHDVEMACAALGFEVDGRAFRPHLTLARVRERTAEDELRRLFRASKRVDFARETEVQSIDLMRSAPGDGGSRYEQLHSAVLRPH